MATTATSRDSLHLVFVYGTLQQGCSNHHILAQARFLGPAHSREEYALYVDYFPKVVRQERVSVIHGELYLVDDYTLALLDDFEDHPFLYRRELIPVITDDGSETQAWIYFHPDASGQLVASGDLKAWLAEQQEPSDAMD